MVFDLWRRGASSTVCTVHVARGNVQDDEDFDPPSSWPTDDEEAARTYYLLLLNDVA
jgi:hypothetical protein